MIKPQLEYVVLLCLTLTHNTAVRLDKKEEQTLLKKNKKQKKHLYTRNSRQSAATKELSSSK